MVASWFNLKILHISLFKSRWQHIFFARQCIYLVYGSVLCGLLLIGLFFILSCVCFRLPLRTVIPTMLCKLSALTTTKCWPHWPGSWLPLAALFSPLLLCSFILFVLIFLRSLLLMEEESVAQRPDGFFPSVFYISRSCRCSISCWP